MTSPGGRAWLEDGLREALVTVEGGAVVRRAIRSEGGTLAIAGTRVASDARVFVLAIGKAAAPMAVAACEVLGESVLDALIVTGDGLAAGSPSGARVVLGTHPVPDERSAHAGEVALSAVGGVGARDELLLLLSGGASALAGVPAPGLDATDLADTTRALLASGADIHQTNCVRKHLSGIAGGRLAAATPASRIHVLAISDVPGDRLDVIGSGPCTADPSTYAEALEVVAGRRLGERLPERVRRHLEAGARGEIAETLKPGDVVFERVRATIVARNADARAALVRALGRHGPSAIDVGEVLSGEARRAGRRLVALADALTGRGPRVLVAGGETVVTVRGSGRGGRSQELALAAAIALEGIDSGGRIRLLAVGSDGRDGPTDAAGGYVDGQSAARARRAGLDPSKLLEDNDSYRFLDAIGGHVRTGVTGTNVMDLVVMVAGGSASSTDRSGSGSW